MKRIFFLLLTSLCFLFMLTAQTNMRLVKFSTNFRNVELEDNQTRFKGITENANLSINYQSDDRSKTFAEIVRAPKRRHLKAVHYCIKEANVQDDLGRPSKGRVQNEFGAKDGFKHIVNEVDVYLPSYMDSLRFFPNPITWLTLQEFWNDSFSKVTGKTFRITLGINKESGIGKELFFNIKTEDYYDGKYHEICQMSFRDIDIPLDQWFTLRTEIIEGNKESGYLRLSVKKVKAKEWVDLFNGNLQTQSSKYNDGSLKPNGVNSLQPLKLYTSKRLIDFMKEKNLSLDVYFTNWKFQGIKY